MLEELVLLRHAHAVHPSGWQADARRPLSPTGREEAMKAGEWLRARVPEPDAVICSPAMRTRETLVQLAAAGCRMPVPVFEPAIYEAGLGDLLDVIERTQAQAAPPRRLWLIGHNPGMEQLLLHLDVAARLHAVPTAGISVLHFEGRLLPTEPGAARIHAVWAP